MKSLNQYVKECIQKNKPDTFIVSENNNKYCPKTKDELTDIIKELTNKGITDLNCIDTSKITDMRGLFATELSEIDNIDISKWDVSNVTNMASMFGGCESFEGKGLENWDVSNVISMKYMFQNCENFKAKDLDKWNVSNVKNMEYMFDNCMKLKKIPSWY